MKTTSRISRKILISFIIILIMMFIATSKIKIFTRATNIMLGDVNEDQVIDEKDMFLMIRHVSPRASIKGWILEGEQFQAGDVTKNNVIDENDILVMLRYTSAKRSEQVAENHPDWLELLNPSSAEIPATGITLNKSTLELNKGSSATLTKTLTPSDSTDSVTWSSSNTNIATVNNGTVTAVAKGTATITATTTSGKKATCEVTVKVPATGITLNKTSLELNKGSSATLTKTLTPSDSTDSVTWSSSNTNIATVSNGAVTAVAKGTATITATTTSGKKATCEVTVKVPATGITLNKTSLSLTDETTATLTATITPTDSTDGITWSSNNTSIATVSGTGKTGTVTITKKGIVTITATTTSGKKATCSITISGWYNSHGTNWYYYENGVMQTGWKKVDGNWYYFNDFAVGGWQEIDDKWYYFDQTTGILQTGWKVIDGNTYYLNSYAVIEWQKIDGKWYYFDPTSGVLQKGWKKIDNKWYYLSETNGEVLTGWQNIDGKWYYLDPNTGVAQSGWLVLDDKTYYLKETGEAVYNCTYTINGQNYNFNSNGELTTTSVLFIGNSKTYYNNLYKTFEHLAVAGGKDVHVEYLPEKLGGQTYAYLYGNRWLEELIETNTVTIVPPAVKETISKRRWDYIILQENGYIYLDDNANTNNLGKAPLTELKKGSKHIIDYVRANSNENVKVIFDAVWIWKTLDQNLEYASTKNIIAARDYIKSVEGIDGDIVYTGNAFLYFNQHYNDPSLIFCQDNLHSSPLGTYLRACCDYATIFKESPEGLNSYIVYYNEGKDLTSGVQVDLKTYDGGTFYGHAVYAQQVAGYVYSNSESIHDMVLLNAPTSITQAIRTEGSQRILDIYVVPKNASSYTISRPMQTGYY